MNDKSPEPDVTVHHEIDRRQRLPMAMVGGFLGTAVMTLMMYFLAPMMLGAPMDVAAMLAGAVGSTWAIGMGIHFINGTVVFPALYARIVYPGLVGSPAVRGATWGAILWLLAQTIVMPMMGGGFFSSQAGGGVAVLASLMGHLVYGWILGVVAGGDETVEVAVHLSSPSIRDSERAVGRGRARKAQGQARDAHGHAS